MKLIATVVMTGSMGIDLKYQPDSFKSKLSTSERKKLGKHGMTATEARESYRSGQEKILQEDIAYWLALEGIWYTRSRMDKRSTTRRGVPDFICCVRGSFLAIEAKCADGRLSQCQRDEIERIQRSSGEIFAMVAYNLKQVIDRVRTLEKLP